MIERIKNIIVNPKGEWGVIEKEETSIQELVTGYLLILALIPAIASLLGNWLIGYNVPFVGRVSGTFAMGLRQGILQFIMPVVSVFIAAFVINMLADSFASKKDLRRAMQLVAYSYTPALVAGVFLIIPSLGIISLIASIYGLYLLYVGLQPMMGTPENKVAVYFLVSLLVMIVVSIVVGLIFTALIVGGSMGYYM